MTESYRVQNTKAEDVAIGDVIRYGGEGDEWVVTAKEGPNHSSVIRFTLEHVERKTTMPLHMIDFENVEVKAHIEKPVTLQPLGDGKYRVNGMNRSAVTGRYIVGPKEFKPFKFNVDHVIEEGLFIGERKTNGNEHLYRLTDETGRGITWFTEMQVEKFFIKEKEEVIQEQESEFFTNYKYKIGQKVGDKEIEARRLDRDCDPRYMVGDKFYSESWVTEQLAKESKYKYEVGQKWRDGNIEILGRTATTSGKNYYTVSRYGIEASYEESRIASFTHEDEEVYFKYKVGEIWTNARGGHRIEEKKDTDGTKSYLVSWWNFEGKICEPAWRDEGTLDSMTRGFKKVSWKELAEYINSTDVPSEPEYKYEIGRRVGIETIVNRCIKQDGRIFYTLSHEHDEGGMYLVEDNVTYLIEQSKKRVTEVGATTHIYVGGDVWKVKDINHTIRATGEQVSFFVVLIDEDASDTDTFKYDVNDRVEVVS